MQASIQVHTYIHTQFIYLKATNFSRYVLTLAFIVGQHSTGIIFCNSRSTLVMFQSNVGYYCNTERMFLKSKELPRCMDVSMTERYTDANSQL